MSRDIRRREEEAKRISIIARYLISDLSSTMYGNISRMMWERIKGGKKRRRGIKKKESEKKNITTGAGGNKGWRNEGIGRKPKKV